MESFESPTVSYLCTREQHTGSDILKPVYHLMQHVSQCWKDHDNPCREPSHWPTSIVKFRPTALPSRCLESTAATSCQAITTHHSGTIARSPGRKKHTRKYRSRVNGTLAALERATTMQPNNGLGCVLQLTVH